MQLAEQIKKLIRQHQKIFSHFISRKELAPFREADAEIRNVCAKSGSCGNQQMQHLGGLKENPIFSAARDPSAHTCISQMENALQKQMPPPSHSYLLSSADIRPLPPMSEITPRSLPLMLLPRRDAILGNIGSAVHQFLRVCLAHCVDTPALQKAYEGDGILRRSRSYYYN